VASPEPGWPQWRGLRRDGISHEKGLLQSWPEDGPEVIWKATGLGRGYSSPVISRGSLYITGDHDGELCVFALDLEGKPRWRAKNGKAWEGEYPGARASAAYADGRLFHLNAHGRLACFDAETGRELWAVDVLKRFEAKNITWAMSECVLVDGPRVIVTAGGRKGAMAALRAATGETVWTTEPVLEGGGADGPSYASPILLDRGGRRLIVGSTTRHLIGVDAEAGRLLWARPLPTPYNVLAVTPVLCEGGVFTAAALGPDGKLFRWSGAAADSGVEEAWTADLDTSHGGVLFLDGVLLGSGYQKFRGWSAVDAATGRILHRTRELAMGSAIWADGRAYCLAQDGTMALVRADRERLEPVSRFRLTRPLKNDAWAHPVMLDGRLYLRYHDTLTCYDIRSRER
jgi:outer membrane protein assembly factor BamB